MRCVLYLIRDKGYLYAIEEIPAAGVPRDGLRELPATVDRRPVT